MLVPKSKFLVGIMKVYSGTHMENYLACAIKEQGIVFYIKSRQPLSKFPNLWYGSLHTAADYAIGLMKRFPERIPIVIAGDIDTDNGGGEWQGNVPFPVAKVYLLKEGVN